jgi:hypothetical protein
MCCRLLHQVPLGVIDQRISAPGSRALAPSAAARFSAYRNYLFLSGLVAQGELLAYRLATVMGPRFLMA